MTHDTIATAAKLDAVPAPLYPCGHCESCKEDHTWPADDLVWTVVDGRGFWCCQVCDDECIYHAGDAADLGPIERDETLATFLADPQVRHQLEAAGPDRLHP